MKRTGWLLVVVTLSILASSSVTAHDQKEYTVILGSEGATPSSIDAGILVNIGDQSFSNLLTYLKTKDFKKMRTWVVNNIDTDASSIFRGVYDRMYDSIKPQSIPQVVLILADYQYKNAFVADHELNVVACMTELMANVEFN